MTLKKIVDPVELIESYSPKELGIYNVENGYRDVIDAVSHMLKDYCEFVQDPVGDGNINIGGPVPDRYWHGLISTKDEGDIGVNVSQSYAQPGVRFVGAKVNLRYVDGISEPDLNIIREALTSSGLENVEA